MSNLEMEVCLFWLNNNFIHYYQPIYFGEIK